MAGKAIPGGEALARQIRSRRQELGLTIEEAAARADVGMKTWSRYEAGESIRQDKARGVCRALNWRTLPGEEEQEEFSLKEYRDHKAWSRFLEENFGVEAALAFAVGSDILLDNAREDLSDLAAMPAGAHIGQLNTSWLRDSLPEQFLTRYDYEFLYQLKCTLLGMRQRAGHGSPMTAHTVLEELLIYLCEGEATAFLELNGQDSTGDWAFDLLGDMDIVTCLYSEEYLEEDHLYHFSHWNEPRFYRDRR